MFHSSEPTLSFTTADVREHLLAFGGIIPNTDVLKLCDAYDRAYTDREAYRHQLLDIQRRCSLMQRELDLLRAAR